jgi:AcrR family transcriptional regulator
MSEAALNGTGAPAKPIENRRERRKRQTRDAIVRAARELFIEKGFDATTLSEIAERADIASSTLFTHFSTKAEIFFADYEILVHDHIRVLETRDRDRETAIEATIRWHREIGDLLSEDHKEWSHHLRRMVDANPLLGAMEFQQYEPSVGVLTREIAYDLGESENDLRPHLLAAIKVATYFTLGRFLTANEVAWDDAEVQNAYVDECLRVASEAIAAVPVPEAVRSYANGVPAVQPTVRDIGKI